MKIFLKKGEAFLGYLSKYANPDLIDKEKDAWAEIATQNESEFKKGRQE
jgi:hypothetical protein